MTPAESPLCCRSDDRDAANLIKTLFITVIMPVRNEAKYIERTLTQLVAQNYDPERFEIIVVDGQSTDGTPERVAKFVEQHRNVHLYANPRRLGSAARNVALRHARGDVVVIVDGHCELKDDRYLAELASAFQRKRRRLHRPVATARCSGRQHPSAGDRRRPVLLAGASPRFPRLFISGRFRAGEERRRRLSSLDLRAGRLRSTNVSTPVRTWN